MISAKVGKPTQYYGTHTFVYIPFLLVVVQLLSLSVPIYN